MTLTMADSDIKDVVIPARSDVGGRYIHIPWHDGLSVFVHESCQLSWTRARSDACELLNQSWLGNLTSTYRIIDRARVSSSALSA